MSDRRNRHSPPGGLGGPCAACRAGLLLAWPAVARADVPFYFAAATFRFAVWWTIPATLLIEAVALRVLFGGGWGRAALASLLANAVSAGAGLLAEVPLLLLLEGAFATTVRPWAADAQALAGLAALLLVAVPVDTVLEMLVLQRAFGGRVGRRTWLAWGAVNLLTVGLCVGAIGWDLRTPPPVPGDEQARIEQRYAPELAWMRQLLREWPSEAEVADDGRLRTRPEFARRRSAEARQLRVVALAYTGPAGAYHPVMRQAERHRWKVAARTTVDGTVFERWEGERDEWLGALRQKPPPRYAVECFVVRPDGHWRVSAMFEADPAHPAEPRPAEGLR